jgi:hypothetical protein
LLLRISVDNSGAITAFNETEQAIAKTEKAAKSSGKAADDSTKVFRDFGKAIGAAFSINAVGQMAKGVLDFASTVTDTADKLDVSVEAIQRWNYAAQQTGGSLEGLTSAATMLYRNLAGGEKSTIAALEQLGLSLEGVRAMRPEQAFELIADRVGKMKNPIDQVAVGAQLMGRGFADNLPAMKAGLQTLGDQAQTMGLIMSRELIAKGEQLGDTWEQVGMRMQKLKAEALVPVLDVFTGLPAPIQTVIAVAIEFKDLLYGLGLVIVAAGGPTAALAGLGTALASIGGVLATAGGAIATFLSGPIGWITAGIIALAGVVYYNWDSIKTWTKDLWEAVTGYAQKIYEGVAYWLVEKFEWIVGKVKGAVSSVTGFFNDAYEYIVGKSIVPDMVTEIGQWIQKLDPLMVQPVDAMTKRTTSLFQAMTTSIDNVFTEWSNTLGHWVQNVVPGLLGRGMAGVASGLLNGIMGLFTGGLNQLISMGVDLAWKGLKKLGSLIAGLFKGEGAKTNDLRDEWMAGLGGLEGAHGLIAGFGNDWTLLNAFEQAYRASSRDDLLRWIEVFQRRLAELQSGAVANPNAPAPGGGGAGGGDPADPRPAGGGGTSIVINNPQFNDRRSIDDLATRIGQTLMGRMTGRGLRFSQ